MDLVDIIKVKYNKLTTSEKRIANYILSDSKKVLESNAQEIGRETETSAATVVRFCKKIDLDGFDNLKVRIAKSSLIDNSEKEIDPILQKDDSSQEVVKKIHSHIDTALKRTLCLINFDNLENIIRIIKNANNVYLYAIGASSLSAYDLYHKLNRINKRAHYNFDAHMNIEFSVHTKPDDVVIAISYGGDSKEVLLAVKSAIKNGTPVIAIVKEGETILSKLADYCLYVPNTEKRVRMGSVESKFAQMMLVDILYFGVVKDNIDSVLEELRVTSNAIYDLKE